MDEPVTLSLSSARILKHKNCAVYSYTLFPTALSLFKKAEPVLPRSQENVRNRFFLKIPLYLITYDKPNTALL